MADDLPQRLEEARSQFAAKNYEAALKTLATCPQDDPKVVHNTAICKYAVKPYNHRALIAKLELPPIQRVKSLRTQQFTPTLVLQYDGQETAFLNAAAILIHNGATAEARSVLLALANVASTLSPAVRVRVACLLHICTRRTSDMSDITTPLLSDAPNAVQGDPALGRMLEITFGDTASFHKIFAKASAVERAMYLNNLGVEAFADGKAAVAGVFFARAAQACSDPHTCTFVVNSIAYNSAVCALSRGVEGSGAVNALLAAQSTMSGSPLLWIRLGQALLDRYQEASRLADNEAFDADIQERVQVLHQGNVPGFPALPPQQASLPAPAHGLLDAAATALQNALALLVDRTERLADAARRLSQAPETAHQLDAVLCMLAYVELTRGNYGAVVSIANEYAIVERDVRAATTARSQAVMACYHVEALCLSNRASQALRLLQSMNLGQFITNKAPNATVQALMLNVCVAYIMSGQWTKALQLSQALVTKLTTPVAQLLLAYLNLAQGQRQTAAEVIAALPQRGIFDR